jgi:predicted DNA binding CopG/RHH family protein
MKQKRAKRKSDRPLRPVPAFASEDAERAFWASADSADYVDWARARRVRLPALHPSTATISLRLPEAMLEELKMLANERDVPYQSLLKVFLADRIRRERKGRRSA